MTDIYSSRGGVTTPGDERARRAVKEFRRMQPMLSAFARMITGRPEVQVVMDAKSNGMTDGKKIMYKPPIELGDPTPHSRTLCDKRDDQMQQRCTACRVRESVYVTIFHEIGHIAHGTFEETSEWAKSEVLKHAVEVSGSKYAAALDKRIKSASSFETNNYLGLATMISPFLPFLVNCLEDARINSEVFRARKGTKVMFFADTWKIFGEGVEHVAADGTVSYKMWKDYPLNQQAAIGVFCIASGYDYSQWLCDEVVAALKDDALTKLCRRLDTVRSVEGTYELSFPILARLRELGFMKNPSDPDTPEEEEESDDADTDPEGTPDEEEGEPEGDDAQGADQEADDAGAEDEDDSESDEAGSESGPASPDGDPNESDTEGDSDGGVGDQNSSDDDSTDSNEPGDGAGDDAEGSPEEGSGNQDGNDSEGAASESGDSTDGDESSGSSDRTGPGNDDAGRGTTDRGELSDEGSGDSSTDEASEESESGGSSDGQASGEAGLPADDDDEQLESGSGAGTEPSQPGSDGEGVGSEDPLRQREGQTSGDDSGDDVESEPGLPPAPRADLDAPDTDGDEPAGREEDVPVQEGDEVSGDDNSDQAGSESDGEETAGDEQRLDSDELIDTGADEGLGGVPVTESDRPFGEPEEMEDLHDIAHPEERPSHVEAQRGGEKEMERDIVQGFYFETPSTNIFGVREHYYGRPVIVNNKNTSGGWDHSRFLRGGYSRDAIGMDGDFETSESILGPALLKMRVAFSDNERGASITNRKSGKINTRVLGKRAHHGDERLFKKRIVPGKKSYFVLIGIDISGSTVGKNIMLAKKAAFAQASLCHRLGVKFAVYAHSSSAHNPGAGRYDGMDLDIYHIKDADEPWSAAAQQRLTDIGPDAANIDGHTIEYYRKILDSRTETHKVMLYYTDGKMPAENFDEELIILRREIKTCRRKKYTLIGVGIRTDSPTQHGLDTVQVDTEADVIKVVSHLEKRLLAL